MRREARQAVFDRYRWRKWLPEYAVQELELLSPTTNAEARLLLMLTVEEGEDHWDGPAAYLAYPTN